MESLLAAFGLVFLAELGDKTQLVALGFGARHRLAPVVVGVTLAYVASTLVSVVIGGLAGAALPTRLIGLVGGVLFLGFAAWNLRDDDDGEEVELAGSGRRVVWTIAGAMFVAELGDKTMLATATLAAQGSPVLVFVGATIGIVSSGLVGVGVGRFTGSRLPERAVRIGSSVLFAAFGVALIAANV